ncbi:MAG: response regulator transcription factor [Myxococcota bacterium]
MPTTLPVVLVADDPLVRGGLAALLPDDMPVVRAIGTDAVASRVAESGAHAVVWDAADAPPTAADLDLGLPIVVLVRPDVDPATVIGAKGVLRRDVDGDRLSAALLAVRAGLRCVDDRFPTAARTTIGTDGPREALTAREVEVLELLAEGRSNREIALALDISVHTAKFHVDRILLKLEASSRTDAVVRAVRLGLLVL